MFHSRNSLFSQPIGLFELDGVAGGLAEPMMIGSGYSRPMNPYFQPPGLATGHGLSEKLARNLMLIALMQPLGFITGPISEKRGGNNLGYSD